MKATGVIRRVDNLGRIVIPREIIDSLKIKRREPGVTDGEPMEIFINGEQIVLRKYAPGCHNCGSLDKLHTVGNIVLCNKCAKEFAKEVE